MGPLRTSVLFLTVISAATLVYGQQNKDYHNARIAWNSGTLTLIQPGAVYGRMVRLPDREILCAFEWNGRIYMRRSADEGQTWSEPAPAASYNYGNAANPELLVLENGSVMLSYNERPADGIHPYTIRISFSVDNGRRWSASTLVYQAGTNSGTGCWEPIQLQLASGEIQLYFSNEQPYPSTTEQQITLLRSFDNGITWSAPERASFRPGHRDGMPVPLTLADGSGTVLAIEDNGLSGTFKPAIVAPASGARWAALETALPAGVYAGAPYLRQFPSGETILSVQSGSGRNNPGTLDYSQMVVYLGDSTAHGFTNASVPFPVAPASNGLWNSLFIKNAVTVTAISGTTINGVAGIWAIDGYLEYPGVTFSPAIQSVTNIAGGSVSRVAPGELVSILSSGDVPANSQPAIYFNGIASPLSNVVGGQITAMVPYGVSDAADAVVDYGDARTSPFPLGVAASMPEIFTDVKSQSVAINQDSSYNSPANAAAKGSYLSFWATGQGQVQTDSGYPCPVLPVQVSVGGVPAQVAFSGLVFPGVLQVNIVVPADAPSGDAVPLSISVGAGANSKLATVAIQ
jgi:uncharacterized protein (TIGR03437 family)